MSGLNKADGWAGLFTSAFRKSRNAMVLLDDARTVVDVNGACVKLFGYKRADLVGRPVWEIVAGGPIASPEEWADEVAKGEFAGEIGIVAVDGTVVAAQWGATVESVSGRNLILFVALSTSRWGARFRRELDTDAAADAETGVLSDREAEIVHLVALGESGPEIADTLNIAHDTVRTHVRNAMGKLGARSRAHLVAKALGEGHVPTGK